MNTLRAQLSREITKERASSSGQSADELYYSTWIHYDKMKFLVPMLKVSKSRDTMKRKAADCESSDVESDSCPPTKKQSIAEKKLELLTKCTDALASKSRPSETSLTPKVSNFALYVDERLNQMNSRLRKLTEKRINDAIFDAEMTEYQPPEQAFPRSFPVPPTSLFPPTSFMEFLQGSSGQVVPNNNQ
eukprot:TCONS_00039088-protein